MKIRADIAALIRAGHSDASVAARLGCGRTTVSRVRRALHMPGVDDRERLNREARPVPWAATKPPGGRLPLAPAQQRANAEQLLAALREAA